MPMHARVARAGELLRWSRDWIGRQILNEQGSMSAERLKLEVALWMYGQEKTVRSLIEKALSRVSD